MAREENEYDVLPGDLVWVPPSLKEEIPIQHLPDGRLINSINLIFRKVHSGLATNGFMSRWGDLLPAMMAEAHARGLTAQISSTKT